ncbi:MAG: GTP-binding protein, partial [Woeseia sp.]
MTPPASKSAVKIDLDPEPLVQKTLLRFLTCGSVDDGKSTLIGSLLFGAGALFQDQLDTLAADSKKSGTQGDNLDFALLLDGLTAEREQGITIDVAYRYFSSSVRQFIVADTPGHEQYTRNMISGASTADVAIILMDARKGMLTQTLRHTYLVSLIGIRHVVLAVNKMDLIDYSESRFRQLEEEYRTFAEPLGITSISCIPMSALESQNIVAASERMPWYVGPALLQYLDAVDLETDRLADKSFRLPVQWVNRPNADFRGYSGMVMSGSQRAGDPVRIQPSGQTTRIAEIFTPGLTTGIAVAGQSVTVTLVDDIDVSRGDLLSTVDAAANVADQFEVTMIWMNEQPMLRGRSYLLKIGARTVTATIGSIKHKINVNTL